MKFCYFLFVSALLCQVALSEHNHDALAEAGSAAAPKLSLLGPDLKGVLDSGLKCVDDVVAFLKDPVEPSLKKVEDCVIDDLVPKVGKMIHSLMNVDPKLVQGLNEGIDYFSDALNRSIEAILSKL